MRIFTAIGVWILFVGGLALYMQERTPILPTAGEPVRVVPAEGAYTLVVTTTFPLERDPFALRTSDEGAGAALQVRAGEREILRSEGPLPPGQPFRHEGMGGLLAGENELYVEASPPMENAPTSHAVRVQILRNGLPVTEKTFWSIPGGRISGTLRFTLPARTRGRP